MSAAVVNDRYVVISSDCHAGAETLEYRPYLDSRWYPEFDAWAGTYTIPFADLVTRDADRSWNSDKHTAELEADGIVGEVVFPNTIPPFFSLMPPTAEDCERRWAGLQAHNRWLADWCARVPGRRAGVAQLMLHDVDAAVAEVKWVKEAGIFGGVLLPTVLVNDPLVPPLYATDYDPLWATCAELGVTIHTHGGIMSSAWGVGKYPAAGAVYISETAYFTHRALSHLIFGGAFERFPDLKLVMTEQGAGWVPDTLAGLDKQLDIMRAKADTPAGHYGAPVVKELKLKPSEYFARNCSLGASFLSRTDAERRYDIGLDNIMWGSDYPHAEGTNPYTLEALRWTFGALPTDDVAAILGGNAARVYGFDLNLLGQVASQVGPPVDEVAVRLEHAPADALSGAFNG
jgi:predicted TIM-barrel fold metal-dependent hydrolase